jgi:hypothetical protein
VVPFGPPSLSGRRSRLGALSFTTLEVLHF